MHKYKLGTNFISMPGRYEPMRAAHKLIDKIIALHFSSPPPLFFFSSSDHDSESPA